MRARSPRPLRALAITERAEPPQVLAHDDGATVTLDARLWNPLDVAVLASPEAVTISYRGQDVYRVEAGKSREFDPSTLAWTFVNGVIDAEVEYA